MRVYLKSGKSFRISQTLAEKLVEEIEDNTGPGTLISVKEIFNNGLSSKLVFIINTLEIAAIK